ncbi:unnamed protein product [Rhizopus stolonifer]
MRNSWAKSAVGTPVKVEIKWVRSPSPTIIGSIHCNSVIHVVMKKSSPKKRKLAGGKEQRAKSKEQRAKSKEQRAKSKEQRAGDIIIKKLTIEYVDVEEGTFVEMENTQKSITAVFEK